MVLILLYTVRFVRPYLFGLYFDPKMDAIADIFPLWGFQGESFPLAGFQRAEPFGVPSLHSLRYGCTSSS
jgi:hypothetical protein